MPVQVQVQIQCNTTQPNTASHTSTCWVRFVPGSHTKLSNMKCMRYGGSFWCVVTWMLNVNAPDAAQRLRADSCLLLPPQRARKKIIIQRSLASQMTLFHFLRFLKRKTCVSYPPCQNLVCFWTWQHPSSSPCFHTVRPSPSCECKRGITILNRFSCFCSSLSEESIPRLVRIQCQKGF